jgi:hypothetical protein
LAGKDTHYSNCCVYTIIFLDGKYPFYVSVYPNQELKILSKDESMIKDIIE